MTEKLPQGQTTEFKSCYSLGKLFSIILTEMHCGVKVIFPKSKRVLVVIYFARLSL